MRTKMSSSLNLPLISEAIVLDGLCNFKFLSSKKFNESLLLLRLDLISSVVFKFEEAFSEKFIEIFDICCLKNLSEKEFLYFVVPRSFILCEEKTYFNLLLVCGFLRDIVYFLVTSYNCFHFAKLTWKCLLEILKMKFGDLFATENGYQGFLSYCEKIKKVIITSFEDAGADNSSKGIKLCETDLLGKKPVVNNLNNVGSEMNKSEDFNLQENSRDNIGNSDNLVEANFNQCTEYVNTPQKISNPLLFNETKSTDEAKCDNSKYVNFLCELLTDSTEHLDEIMKLLNTCVGKVDPNKLPRTEFEAMRGDVQEICAMAVQKSSTSPPSTLSDSSHFEPPSSSTSDVCHSECPILIESNEDESKCPLKNSEEKMDVMECCELCIGKEEYLKNWEIDFLERYPELKQCEK